MATVAPQFEVPRPVARTIARLRRMVRGYIWLEGLFVAVIVLGVGYWGALLVDWLLEPTPAVRFLFWLATAAAMAWTAYRYILRRAFAKLPDDSLALLIERQNPRLREGLVTTVQAGDGLHREGYHPQLVARTSRAASEAVGSIRLGRVLNQRPLIAKGVAAALLAGSIGLFAWQAPQAFSFWGERMAFSHELWPRTNRITVLGFDRASRTSEVRVARDSTFEVLVEASLVDGFQAPEEVEIRWRRASDGLGSRDPMLQVGEAVPGRDDSQRFRYEFKVTSDIEFDVIGGDDRVRNLRLVAVDRPAVKNAALEITYPKYLQRSLRRIALSKRAELPEGSSSVCYVTSTKPLASARVYDPGRQLELEWELVDGDPLQLQFPIDAAEGDMKLSISLTDADGVENLSPYGLIVSVVPDAPPELSVQLRGIGTAVTPQARIPVTGVVTDDYAVRDVWIEYQVDAGEPQRRPLPDVAPGFPRLKVSETFDLDEDDPATREPLVALTPGQRLVFRMQADDYYDLGEEPRVGLSQRFSLDVVTPSQLRALLEKRELGLRQRFEAITEKMAGVHDLLDRIETPTADEAPAADPGTEADEVSETARQFRRDLSRIVGAGQNATQLAFETGGVAQGFREILAELENNRVDTEDLRKRLQDGIAAPLRHIAEVQLPELERLLAEHLAAHETRADNAAETLAATRIQADAILEAMQAVLDRMLELESYNELIELLRGIVAEQQQINDATKQQQREKLRRLLEE